MKISFVYMRGKSLDMKITSISVQAKNPNRVNISIDGKYRLSLDVYQVTELGIRNGMDVVPDEIAKWEEESTFGKLYARALEYTMIRPHSAREVRDYLWRKTLTKRVKSQESRVKTSKKTKVHTSFAHDTYSNSNPAFVEKPGVSKEIADRVYDRLLDRGYIDDEKFVRWWLENRHARKGASQRKLIAELRGKGVEQGVIESLLPSSSRSDVDELRKVVAQKRRRYDDQQKFIQYLQRHGFAYDDIRMVLAEYYASD